MAREAATLAQAGLAAEALELRAMLVKTLVVPMPAAKPQAALAVPPGDKATVEVELVMLVRVAHLGAQAPLAPNCG
jgi:hypothetical protein